MLRTLSKHRTIQLSTLKRFVLGNLPEDSALYRVLLVEKDEMKPGEFVSRVPLWLALPAGGYRKMNAVMSHSPATNNKLSLASSFGSVTANKSVPSLTKETQAACVPKSHMGTGATHPIAWLGG